MWKLFILLWLALGFFYFASWRINLERPDHRLGITFSDFYVERELELDPDEVFRAIVDDLSPRRMRLIAYWNRIEKETGAYDFSALDRYVEGASERGIDIVLAAGYRTPRWPECHISQGAGVPGEEAFEKRLLAYLEVLVNRYKNNENISMWQIENEPFVAVFGECPPTSPELFAKEIALARSLDPNRPILVTDSGELSMWHRAWEYGDAFGTTLYRHIWNEKTGAFTHVIPPLAYTLREKALGTLYGEKQTVIAELQAEPWTENNRPLPQSDFDAQIRNFGVAELESIVGFAKRTGIRDIYLWGAEWWYWRKLKGDPSFWEAGKEILKGGERGS